MKHYSYIMMSCDYSSTGNDHHSLKLRDGVYMMRAPLLGVVTGSWAELLDRDRGNYGWQSESKVRRVDNINVEIIWQAVPVSENEAYCTLVRNALGKRVSSAKRANGYCILARLSAFLTRSDTLSFTRAVFHSG